MKLRKSFLWLLAVAALLILQACGSPGATPEPPAPGEPVQMQSDLPANGIGVAGTPYTFTFVYDESQAQTSSMRTQAAGDEVLFRWSWGDGQGKSEAAIIDNNGRAHMEVTHTYTSNGPYAISVTVEEPEVSQGVPGKQLAKFSYIVQIGEALATENFVLQCDGDPSKTLEGERGVHSHVWDLSGVPTGATIDMWFNTVGQPDKYVVEYPENTVAHDTGWRGSEGQYNSKVHLYPGGLAGPPVGTVEGMVTKLAGHNTLSMTIIGPDVGTVWYYNLTCNP